ncbi:MAG TPA: GNAT family N-acetyltransferase [Ktedonobacterales bacterium]
MDVDLDHVTVHDNEAEERYEANVNGYLAEIDYERVGDTLVLIHTEVPGALEGQGIAGKLVRTALEGARAKHLSVVPFCPYAASYIRRHPEYKDLVPQKYWAYLSRD